MKKIINILFLIGSLLAGVQTAVAQSQGDMRLNEVLVTNTDDFEDDFGHKHAWIELFNASYGTVNIGGCFLSNDRNNLRMYPIPKGDVLTQIKPRQHILFWADNQPMRGTFHINFILDATKENRIYFTSSDGRTIIDSVPVPAGMQSNISYGRAEDGIGEWKVLDKTTPSTNNIVQDKEAASQRLSERDPYGVIMAMTAMSVVFVALIILYLVFKQIGLSSIRLSRRKAEQAAGPAKTVENPDAVSGEVYAAIATAVHLHIMQEEAHDVEETILTINKVARTYSPWSSKIYGLREVPNKQ